MYVGLTRAKAKLFLSHALQRTLFGNTASFIPSGFLNDIPQELLEIEGAEREAIRPAASQPRSSWQGAINTPAAIRDNKDLELAVGDRVRHEAFGEGKVIAVAGNPPRQTAEVRFASGGTKRLLVKMAPIEKL